MLIASILIQLAQTPDYSQQPVIDAEATRYAERAGRRNWLAETGEPLPVLSDTRTTPLSSWFPASDAVRRTRSSYHTPQGYRYPTTATADLDRDGRPDTVTLVESGKYRGLRVTYGALGKRSVIVDRGNGGWASEGVFAAGSHAVMINFPESRVYFIFQRREIILGHYVGD